MLKKTGDYPVRVVGTIQLTVEVYQIRLKYSTQRQILQSWEGLTFQVWYDIFNWELQIRLGNVWKEAITGVTAMEW